ncbi:MAG: hypothetical protein QOE99_1651 [Actinomycetota bacterium]|nr:hypothetical protein [Actinomycetota bacterium]
MTTTTYVEAPSQPMPWLQRLRNDTVFLLTGFPIAIASFTVLVTGVSASAGLLITLIGVPLLVATLYAARGFAWAERRRIGWISGTSADAPVYRSWSRGPLGWLETLRDKQSWLDLAHGLLLLPVTIVSWTVAVTWWLLALFSIPWPLYGHAIESGNDSGSRDVLRHIGVDSYAGRSICYVVFGLVMLVTLPFVLRATTAVQVRITRSLLADQ